MRMLKPYEKYKDTGINLFGKIPMHWNTERVKSEFNMVKKPNEQKKPTVLSLTQNGIKIRDISQNQGQMAENYEGYNSVSVGDICLNPMDLESGAAATSHYNGVISNAYFTIQPKNSERINTQFYGEYFNMHFKLNIFYPFGKGVGRPEGSGGRWTLNRDTFLKFPIIYPPKDEQDQIVRYLNHKLSKINKYIKAKKRENALLIKKKQAIINRAVLKGVDPNAKMKPSGFDCLKQIPNSWRTIRLRYLGSFQNGVSESGNYFETGTPFVSYGDAYKNIQLPVYVSGVANSTKSQQIAYSVEKGDIFFTRTSETAEEIGFSSVCLKNIEYAVFSGFLIRFRPYKNVLNEKFSMYYFRNTMVRNYFVQNINLVIRASLSQTLLKDLPVILPPLRDQQKIVNYIEVNTQAIDKALMAIKKEIELITEYRTRLISDVVTGKVDVRGIAVGDDTEDESDTIEIEETEDVEENLDNQEE